MTRMASIFFRWDVLKQPTRESWLKNLGECEQFNSKMWPAFFWATRTAWTIWIPIFFGWYQKRALSSYLATGFWALMKPADLLASFQGYSPRVGGRDHRKGALTFCCCAIFLHGACECQGGGNSCPKKIFTLTWDIMGSFRGDVLLISGWASQELLNLLTLRAILCRIWAVHGQQSPHLPRRQQPQCTEAAAALVVRASQKPRTLESFLGGFGSTWINQANLCGSWI